MGPSKQEQRAGRKDFLIQNDSLIQRDSFRLVRVYLVGFRVLVDFLWFRAVGKLRGPAWRAKNLVAVQKRNARRVVRLILRVRGLFVKIGQMMSILTNFLPESFREELEEVQDQVPPSPFEAVKRRLGEELGANPDTLFAFIDPEPLAAASLAQVHRARLANGLEVAIKVQHPDIQVMAHRDLRTLGHLIAMVGFFTRIKGLNHVHQTLTQMIEEELDFRCEARNMTELAGLLHDEPGFQVPRVVESLSTGRVLTASFEDGIKVTDIDRIEAAGLDRTDLARRLLRVYCRMVLDIGVYHADPHPGNLLVRADGTLVLLDFGAISRVSAKMRKGMLDFVRALIRSDDDGMHAALDHMGFVAKGGQGDLSARIVTYFQRRFLDQISLQSLRLDDIQADFQTKLDTIADFRDMGIGMGEVTTAFQVPSEWVLLHRTLFLLLGLTTHLDPNLNPISEIRPFIERLLLYPEGGWRAFVTASLRNAALDVLSVYGDTRRALRYINQGRLEVRLAEPSRSLRSVTQAAKMLVSGMFASVAALIAHSAWSSGQELLFRGAAIAGGLFLLVTLWLLARSR